MKIEDIDDILIIENLCFLIPWTEQSFHDEISKNRHAHYKIIIFENKIIGYIGFWQVLDEGHITNIAIHPEYRNRGLASLLLENTLIFCKNINVESLTLEVRKSNLPARSLYKKYGFIEEGCRKKYYSDNNEDAIIMWRRDI